MTMIDYRETLSGAGKKARKRRFFSPKLAVPRPLRVVFIAGFRRSSHDGVPNLFSPRLGPPSSRV